MVTGARLDDIAATDSGPGLTLLCAAFGNSRARLGLFRGRELEGSVAIDSPAGGKDAEAAMAEAVRTLTKDAADTAAIVVASVHRAAADRGTAVLADVLPAVGVYRVGRDLPIEIPMKVEAPDSVGEDRLMNAIGAFSRTEQATLVIDAGTAVTIDFVDGEGAFCGGVIMPGVRMMLDALASGTDALPAIAFEPEGEGDPPFAGTTEAAMRAGCAAAVRGAMRDCLDRYAEAFGAYPKVVATGGDVGLLEPTGLVEHAAADLQLMGIQACAEAALSESEDQSPDGAGGG